MTTLAFKPRYDRLDEILVKAAERRNSNANTLDRSKLEPGLSLFELFPKNENLPRHFGKVSNALWVLADMVFKPADFAEDCPPGFSAKSVQVVDIYERAFFGNKRTSFLYLWANMDEPVLIACPEVPAALLETDGKTGEDTRVALRSLVEEMVDRLNLMVPIALALSAEHQTY